MLLDLEHQDMGIHPSLFFGHAGAHGNKLNDLVASHRLALVAVKTLGIQTIRQPKSGIGFGTKFIEAFARELFLGPVGKNHGEARSLWVNCAHTDIAVGVLLKLHDVVFAFVNVIQGSLLALRLFIIVRPEPRRENECATRLPASSN